MLQDYLDGKKELGETLGLGAEAIETLRGRAQFFIDGGHHERALMMLEMLAALDRNDLVVALLVVETQLALGLSDAADGKLDELEAHFGKHADITVSRADLLLRTGHIAPAAELLRQVLAEDPQAQTRAGQRAQAVAHRGAQMLE